MSYDFQLEKFRDIYDFDRAINERQNNSVMSDCHASQKHSSWSGASTYEEAEELLAKGWSTYVEDMKKELSKFSNTIERTRNKRKAYMAGYAPIVPAAIKGVPKAMWTDEKVRRAEKKNYLHIYFNNTGSADEDADDLMKSGMTILKLSIMLEKMGIKTKIDILPFVSRRGDSVYGCSIPIKDYRQPFNLQKMAYPIAHTSIFRRQGFKWLETMKNCTNSSFNCGYGAPLYDGGAVEQAYKDTYKMNDKGSVYINYYDCKRSDFDPERLAKRMNINLEVK